MNEFKEGQRVKVEYEGTVAPCGGGMDAVIKSKDAPYDDRLYLLDLAGIKVTLLDPPDWPPRVGDIWEAEGREYYVCGSSVKGGVIIEPFNVTNPGSKWQYADELLDDFKALNPTLVRRRGQ